MFHSKPSWHSFGIASLAVMAALVFLTFWPRGSAAQSNRRVATQAIQDKYQRMNGQNVLGEAQSQVRPTYDRNGYFRNYERGAIYWHPQYGVHEVHGAIFLKWHSTGRASGFLGYPLTDETPTADGKGRYSQFEHGVIYWHPRIGNTAYEVHGGILAKWKQLGLERSPLGYPITDEHDIPNGNGRVSLFQHGAIYWIQGSGGAKVKYLTSKSAGFGTSKWSVIPTPTPGPTPTKCTQGPCTVLIPSLDGSLISNLHTAYCSSPDEACTGVDARQQFPSPDDICLRWMESSRKNEQFVVSVLQEGQELVSEGFTSEGGHIMCRTQPVTLPRTGMFVAEVWYNNTLKETVSWSVATPSPTPVPSGPGHEVRFKNNCRFPVRLALRYKQSSGEWRTGGWWNFAGNKSAYLTSNGQRIRSHSTILFYYAEITQEPYTEFHWSGDENVVFSNQTLPMREKNLSPDSDGDLVLSLTCSNL